MGNEWSNRPVPLAHWFVDIYHKYGKDKDVWPEMGADPTYDPLYGFDNGREERVMYATQAEMDNGNLPLRWRDYCGHRLLDLKVCQRDKDGVLHPSFYRSMISKGACKDELHAYYQCQRDDYHLRMKEFEREKRLNQRRLRKIKKGIE